MTPGAARFLGWRMVAVAALHNFVTVGFLFYSFGVYLTPIEQELGVSRTAVSWGLGLTNAMSALSAPVVGRLLDRLPIRNVMSAGAVTMALGFALLSRVEGLGLYLFCYATFLAFGASAVGNLASAKLVASWFETRRGTALGIATMGVSLSGLLVPPFATWLVLHVGWRAGFGVYAALILLLLLPTRWIVVSRPEDVGQRPDGLAPASGGDQGSGAEAPVPSREILRTRNFWAIVFPFALGFGASSAILTHLVPYALGLGMDAYRAASLVSVAAGVGLLGNLFFGRLADRAGPRRTLVGTFALQGLAVGLTFLGTSYPLLLLIAFVYGLGVGGMIPLQSILISAAFGRLSFGRAFGLARPFQVPIHAAGVPFAGLVFERTGAYTLAFEVFLVAYVVAMVGALAIRIERPRAAVLPS